MGEDETGREKPEDAAERGPTMRVVLKREGAIMLPEGVADAQVADALAALYGKRVPRGVRSDGWFVVGEFEGHSKKNAIEAHAGKAGTATAKVGVWKAPTTSSWAGGLKHSAPPRPLVESEAIE